MNDFTYSVARSFNQYLNGTLGGTNLVVGGSQGSLILNAYPAQVNLTVDTVTAHIYNNTYTDIGGGRWAGGTQGRFGEFDLQIDVLSPPNINGEPRQGANRKFKDKVEEVLKDRVRINLIDYGTAGTSVAGAMFVRQTGAQWLADEEMEGWSHWALQYRLRAVDHD